MTTHAQETSMIHFRCQRCGRRCRVAAHHGGRQTACPSCSRPMVIPLLSTPVGGLSPPHGGERTGASRRWQSLKARWRWVLLVACLVALLGLLWLLLAGNGNAEPGTPVPSTSGEQDLVVKEDEAAPLLKRTQKQPVQRAPVPPLLPEPKPLPPHLPDQAAARKPAPEPARPPVQAPKPDAPRIRLPEEIVTQCKPAVAVVRGKTSSGSGFLVRPNLLATNAHVVADELEVQVFFLTPENPEAAPLPARLIYYDRRRDLALLQVETNLTPLPLAASPVLRAGQEVTVIGSPILDGALARVNAVSHGVVDELVLIDGRTFYQLRVPVHAGNSGGPVLDGSGRVIGVLTAKAQDREDVSFCVSVQALNQALEQLGAPEGWDAQARKAVATHRTQFVYLRVRAAGDYAAAALDVRASRRLGQSSHSSGSAADDREALARFRVLHRGLRRLLNPVIQDLLRDPHPTPEIHKNLYDLLVVYRQMHDLIEHPTGSVADYQARAAQLKDWRKKYEQALHQQLDLPSRVPIALKID